MVMPSRRYDTPSGKFGRRFVVALVGYLHWLWDRLWNLERLIVFQTVILQQACHFTASQAIRQRIEKRLDACEAGRHGMLVEETLLKCTKYLTVACREESEEHRTKTYHSLVLRGNLQKTVR